MYRYHCLNPISQVGLEKFPGKYENTDNQINLSVLMHRSFLNNIYMNIYKHSNKVIFHNHIVFFFVAHGNEYHLNKACSFHHIH